MEPLPRPYEIYRERFQSLLSSPDYDERLEKELEIWRALAGIFESLANRAETLEAFIEAMQASAEPWTVYSYWPFIKVTPFYSEQDRELLVELPHGIEMVALLDDSEAYRLQILVFQEALEQEILGLWREKNPRFSSMGIIDSDIQGDALKDVALARR